MDQTELKKLLRKYVSSELTADEIVHLKSLILHLDKSALADSLQDVWTTYTDQDEKYPQAFDEVLHNIRSVIQPRKKISMTDYLWRVAVIILLPLLVFSTAYLFFEKKSFETSIAQEYQIDVAKGEKASITLPDGTKVYLNSESSLTYPASFAVHNRMVNLLGEAYFEVKEDKKSPFVVHTPSVQVKVLGTTFNLFAYPTQSWFEATLVEGSIEVMPYANPGEVFKLTPNQKARYNKDTGEWDVSKTDLRTETAWKRGDLIFYSQSLATVFERLEMFYGVNIKVDGVYPELLFTGNYHEDDINEVLKNLQYHYNFTYTKVGMNVHINFID